MRSVEIAVTSPLHTKLKEAVLERWKFSKRKMQDFHRQWDLADDSLRAYIPEKEVDALKKADKELLGKVDYVTLEVPYVYAQVMTAHTYWSSVFLSRSPIWQFTARHGETQDAVQAVEAVMDYQLKVGSQLPVLYNWLYDLSRYSLGVVGTYWVEEQAVVARQEMRQPSLLGIPLPGKPKAIRVEEIVPGYHGNKVYNIRPYDFFPDPRVPICEFQKGEFVIRRTTEGISNLKALASSMPGCYINLDLAERSAKRTDDRDEGSPRIETPFDNTEEVTPPGTNFLNLMECYIKLIPKDWGLGPSPRVEKWCIVLAEQNVIIAARPLGYYHDMFPFSVVEGNFGADSFAKVGLSEVIRPMTDIITWLVNSHFYNVRKALNDTRVVDPSRIVMKDLLKPAPGGIIRLKPEAYGTDPRLAVHQLQNTDVTRSHINDTVFVEQMVQRVSGVVDNIMGAVNSSGRKTATEVRTATGWSSNRLKIPAEYNSALGWDPLARIMLANTQQLMDIQRKYQIAGSALDQAAAFVEVTPERIAGFFDFVPVDGTLPIDRLAQANFWKELLMQMARIPELAMQWDIGGMLAHTMKLQGERNIDRFRIQLRPGAAIAAGAQAGNIVPIGGAGGQRGSTGTSGGTF